MAESFTASGQGTSSFSSPSGRSQLHALVACVLAGRRGVPRSALAPTVEGTEAVTLTVHGAPGRAPADRVSASIISIERHDKDSPSAATDAKAIRVQRLREDARRPLSVNLSEGIALSHKLLRFTGIALKS